MNQSERDHLQNTNMIAPLEDLLLTNVPNQEKDDPINFIYTTSQPSEADTNEFNQYAPIVPIDNLSTKFLNLVNDSHFKRKQKLKLE